MAEKIELQSAAPALVRKDILDLDDFSVGEINLVLETTKAMKEILSRPIKKVPALRGKTVVILFYEPSTRTRVSFEMAAKNLSADVINIAAQTSSVAKGESLVDTIRTLQALGADMIVMRHPRAGAPYLVARSLRGSVINGGDGVHAHPTQALLDLYTINEKMGSVAGHKVVIIGDILRSRVARSNIWGLTKMGAKVVLCGPATLLPPGLAEWVKDPGQHPLEIYYNLDLALEEADVVMPLRLQWERQGNDLIPDIREYIRLYSLTAARMRRAKPEAIVMHPGPMNEGVEIMPEVAYSTQSVIEEQVTNGVAVRMALLYLLGGEPHEV